MQLLFFRALRAHSIFLLASILLFTTGCEDEDHDHDEEHTDADGFLLEDVNGSQVYSELKGAVEGAITLSVGDTLELSVHFLDDDGNEIEHEEEHEGEHEGEEEEGELKISGSDSNIAIIETEEHEEGEEEHHEMAIHIIGVSAGSTSFKLQLMHEGHADYTSTNNVPVTVN